jgi:tight adherence protein C
MLIDFLTHQLASLPLYVGFGELILATILGLYYVMQSTGDRPQIERSLRLLEQEIDRWAQSKRQVEESEPFFRQLLKLLTPVGKRLVLPSSLVDIERQINFAGNPALWSLENILALKLLSLVGGAALAFTLIGTMGQAGLLLGVLVALLGYEIPDLTIRQMANNRQAEILHGLPDTLDLLTVTVEAGLGFDAAVSQVSEDTEGPFAGELSRYLQEKQLGFTGRQALESLASRTSIDEVKSFCSALLQADKIGISVGPVLRELTQEMRIKRRQRAQEQAQKVPVKILLPLVFFIFPVFFIVVIGPTIIKAMTQF